MDFMPQWWNTEWIYSLVMVCFITIVLIRWNAPTATVAMAIATGTAVCLMIGINFGAQRAIVYPFEYDYRRLGCNIGYPILFALSGLILFTAATWPFGKRQTQATSGQVRYEQAK